MDTKQLLQTPRPLPPGSSGNGTQITAHQDWAQIALNAIRDAVIRTNGAGEIEYLNPGAIALLGKNLQQAQGCTIAQVCSLVLDDTEQPLENPVAQVLNLKVGSHNTDCATTLQSYLTPATLTTHQGKHYAIDLSIAPMYTTGSDPQSKTSQKITGAVMVFRDVTETRKLAQQLSWEASHDALTRLVNRREFEHRIEAAIATAQKLQTHHVLCYIDLDRFKLVNNTCGHRAGDILLCELAQILQQQLRGVDTLGRLGGDEFGILIQGCSLLQAELIAERIRLQVQAFRFQWNGKRFGIGVSIGLVQIDANSPDVNHVLSAADAACYAAKEAGRNRIYSYRATDDQLAQQHSERQWISRIHDAIEMNRFRLYAQAIVPVNPIPNGREQHVEILLRMVDEAGQIIAPGAFILAAERYGLTTEIDRVVIQTFFKTYAQYRAASGISSSCATCQHCFYAINLSARSLNDEQFLEFIHQQFALYQVSPQEICFEITETAAIGNLQKASQFIQELKQQGCRFALDDFGSGLNSFAYLKELPIDFLKIDGHFIKNLADEPVNRELVACMNRIAHVLEIDTIAEWVEDELTLEILRSLEVDYAQGYGIGKPQPLENLLRIA
jgi:diguanylate cyclase (GGDEF)-like protein